MYDVLVIFEDGKVERGKAAVYEGVRVVFVSNAIASYCDGNTECVYIGRKPRGDVKRTVFVEV